MEASTASSFGCRDMTGTLRRVFVRTPQEDVRSWAHAAGAADPIRRVPTPGARGSLLLLEEAGVEVVFAPPVEGGNLDGVYALIRRS